MVIWLTIAHFIPIKECVVGSVSLKYEPESFRYFISNSFLFLNDGSFVGDKRCVFFNTCESLASEVLMFSSFIKFKIVLSSSDERLEYRKFVVLLSLQF